MADPDTYMFCNVTTTTTTRENTMRHLLLPKASKMLAFTCFCLYVYIVTAGAGPDPFDRPGFRLCCHYVRTTAAVLRAETLSFHPPARSPTLLLCNVLAL